MRTESILIATDNQRAGMWAQRRGWRPLGGVGQYYDTLQGETVHFVGTAAALSGVPRGTRVWCADCWYAMPRGQDDMRTAVEAGIQRGQLLPVNFEVARPEAITEYPIGHRQPSLRDLVLQLRYMSDGELQVRIQDDDQVLHTGVLRSCNVEGLHKELAAHVERHGLVGRLTCNQCGGEEVYHRGTLVPRRPAGWTCKKCGNFTED